MMHISHITATTSACVGTVWRYMSSPDHWPLWQENVKRVMLHGHFRQGTSGVMVMKDSGELCFSVLAHQPYSHYVIAVTTPFGGECVIRRACSADDDLIRIVEEVHFVGTWRERFFMGRLKSVYREDATRAMSGLWGFLEGLSAD
ncbi:hypothetical protein [Deinococcus misasensis]|uniref:hypothetical protein n=1 Tax=Deinococcus misasensis TaxID=392413 RepID=UPI00054ECBC7|nr:hypothetical protein [Deinococcus misasensis]